MAKRTKPDRQLIPTTKRAGSPVVSGGLLDDVRNLILHPVYLAAAAPERL